MFLIKSYFIRSKVQTQFKEGRKTQLAKGCDILVTRHCQKEFSYVVWWWDCIQYGPIVKTKTQAEMLEVLIYPILYALFIKGDVTRRGESIRGGQFSVAGSWFYLKLNERNIVIRVTIDEKMLVRINSSSRSAHSKSQVPEFLKICFSYWFLWVWSKKEKRLRTDFLDYPDFRIANLFTRWLRVYPWL